VSENVGRQEDYFCLCKMKTLSGFKPILHVPFPSVLKWDSIADLRMPDLKGQLGGPLGLIPNCCEINITGITSTSWSA
jgi:hypothetical protein